VSTVTAAPSTLACQWAQWLADQWNTHKRWRDVFTFCTGRLQQSGLVAGFHLLC